MKKRILILCLITATLFAGCANTNTNTNVRLGSVLITTVSRIDADMDEHIEQLHEYDSPYTICYQNDDDTYSMFIFASPIQYKTDSGYEIIDNTVVVTEKEGFAYENKANEVKHIFRKHFQTLFE